MTGGAFRTPTCVNVSVALPRVWSSAMYRSRFPDAVSLSPFPLSGGLDIEFIPRTGTPLLIAIQVTAENAR